MGDIREMSAAEEVREKCLPSELALKRAWEGCVKATRKSAVCNRIAFDHTEEAVRWAGLARQHLVTASLVSTKPIRIPPETCEN